MTADRPARRKWIWIVAGAIGLILICAATVVFLLVRLAMSID